MKDNVLNFSLLVKPASFKCNLRCDYCFYLCKEDIFSDAKPMSAEMLERLISSFMAIDMDVHAFGWQGGEPMLTGLDFFKKITFFQEKYGRSGKTVSNGLQTNGILLDDEWCRHLARYNFLVGISIDGPPALHNAHRRTASGGETYDLVIKGLDALKRNAVEHNVLTLVSDANISFPLDVYDHLMELGCRFHQYIECVELDESGRLAPFSVRPGQWGEFLCSIFDRWYGFDRRSVSVRLFDSILAKMLDGRPNVCAMADDCRSYLVVEHNGDVYPCDFFVLPELKLGNIADGEWNDFITSDLYAEFGRRKNTLNEKCVECPYLKYCAGCCPKNRFGKRGDPRKLSALCEGWKLFFSHCLGRLQITADEIRAERMAYEAGRGNRAPIRGQAVRPAAEGRRPGRNEPCPCGSGKKFKKCCGR